MNDLKYQITIAQIGPRPPCRKVVEHVYGVGANVDTEGNSNPAAERDWTWLHMCLRPTKDRPIVEIAMSDNCTDVMVVCSDDALLALRTAAFLASETGGKLLG